MEWGPLKDMAVALPESVLGFGCYQGGEMVASAVCIRVNSQILYIFYWGESPGFESWSPVSLLAQSIYDYAASSGYRLLDAGTATLSGEPNHGLISYKKALGFVESLKITLEKNFR